jgi:hypothetical protein
MHIPRLATTLGVVGLLLAIPAVASAAVRITKIQYNPPGSDSGSNASLNQEYVVIKNTGTKAVTLTGWSLRDQQRHVYKFGTLKLAAGKSVTIHTGNGTDDRNDVYWGSAEYVWNNDGDKATLKTRNGHTVDACGYSGGGQSVTC